MKIPDWAPLSEVPRALDTNIVVRLATQHDAADWDMFVHEHPDATVFHRWAWSVIIEAVHGHKSYFLIAISDGRVVGVLPLAHNKTILFGNTLVGLPFCPYGGPLSINPDVEDALLNHAISVVKEIGADHLELRRLIKAEALPNSDRTVSTQELYVTFRKSLSANHDENMLAIPRKQRAMVRKGIKANLVANLETVKEFFPLYADNIHRHGTPGSPKRFFEAIASAFGNDCEILIVRSPTGEALSGVLTLFFRNEVLPFYAGDVFRARDFAANDFKYWEVMRRAVDRGANIFDYGRSKKGTGPFAFKSYWGFEPHQLYYEHFNLSGPIPEHNPLNPKFQLMISTWRRLPRPLVNWLGPKVVKGLG